MIFTNLKVVPPRTGYRNGLVAALLLTTVFLATTAWKAAPLIPSPSHLHAITPEEREAVVMDLERMDGQFSDLGDVISAFRKTVQDGPADVAELPITDKLVWKNGSAFVFSSRFFSADSGTQEVALLKLFLPEQLAIRPPSLPDSVSGFE